MKTPLAIILAVYLATEALGYLIEYLNVRRLKSSHDLIPPEFGDKIDLGVLEKARGYTLENTRFSNISSFFNNLIVLIFFFGGLLNLYGRSIGATGLPFIVSGLLFFLALYYADTLLMLPFGLYRTFRIEKAHGFNTMTTGLWIKDLIKQLAISSVLMCAVISAGLFIVLRSPELWWLWVWLLFLIFSVFMMYISPYVIEPLFNRFDPVQDRKSTRLNSSHQKISYA